MSAPLSIDEALAKALPMRQAGQLKTALSIYEQILGKNARHGDALHLSGLLLHQGGESASGLVRIEAALEVKPDHPVYLYNSGVIHQELGQDGEALDGYRKCLPVDPGNVSAWVNLGNILSDHGHFGEALECHRNAAKLQPEVSEHQIRRARDLRLIGDIDGALAVLGEVLNAEPDNEAAWSAMLFASQYQAGNQPCGTASTAHTMGRAIPGSGPCPGPACGIFRRTPARGISFPGSGQSSRGDFSRATARETSRQGGLDHGLLQRSQGGDEYLLRNRAAAGEWREVAGLSDDELEQELRGASLDVLIDLCGHGENNRLQILARKPAAIQITWAGYTGTTGLGAIDYLISDTLHTPDQSEGDYAETLLCFPCDYIPWEAPHVCSRPGTSTAPGERVSDLRVLQQPLQTDASDARAMGPSPLPCPEGSSRAQIQGADRSRRCHPGARLAGGAWSVRGPD